MKPGLLPKPVEFDGIKIRVVELFPDTKEFNGIPVPEPVLDQIIGPFRILVPGDIRDTDPPPVAPREVIEHLVAQALPAPVLRPIPEECLEACRPVLFDGGKE